MSAQVFEYTKISNLPAVNALTGTDVFIVNASGETSKISLTSLISIITTGVSGDISALATRMGAAESNITSLSSRVDTDESNITSLGNKLTTAEGNITTLGGRVDAAESNITSLAGRLTTDESNITGLAGTVDNIITAGFNLIGIDTVTNNSEEGE